MGLKKIGKKAFGKKGLLGGQIGSMIGGFALGPVGVLAGAAIGSGLATDLLGLAIKQLVKMPKLPDNLAERGQDYNVEFRNNKISPGDRKPVGYGEFRVWPAAVCSYPVWNDNQQVWLLYGVIGRGVYEMLDLNIGTTPIGNFGRQRSLILGPGDPLPPDFMHANMFVSTDVGEQDLQAGGTKVVETDAETVTASVGTAPGTTRLTLSNFFDGVYVDSQFFIRTGPNAGGYVVKARDGGSEPNWVEISPTLPAGSFTAEFSWQAYDNGSVTITVPGKDEPAVELVFSAGPDQIRSTLPTKGIGKFNPGDLLLVRGGANDGETFTVVWSNGDDTIGVSPAPTPQTTTDSTLRLLRRWTPAVYGTTPGERTRKSTLTIRYSNGLAFAKGEHPNNRTIEYALRWRSVDDVGNPLGAWNVSTFSQTDNVTNKPVYIEHTLEYPDAVRPQMQLARLTSLPDDSRYVDSATWVQLRSELESVPGEDPANDPLYTRVAIMVGVTGQLNEVQQQSFNGLAQRWLPQYIDGEWTAPLPTRSPVWAMVDWMTQEHDGSPIFELAHFDADELAARAADGDDRGLHFDAYVDAEVPFWETAQNIAERDRLMPYLDPETHIWRMARDEASAPVAAFAHGFGCSIPSLSIDTPTSQTKFGVRAIYTDPATWQQRDDGPVYGDDTDPRDLQLFGCKEFRPAYDAVAFDYLDKRLRVVTGTLQTWRDDVRPLRVQSRVWITHPIGMGQASEIVTLSGTALRVRQPIQWQDGAQHYVILQGDGAPSARINVTRGATDQHLVLASVPAVTLNEYGGPRLNLCLFGWDAAPGIRANGPRIAICESAQAQGLREATVQLRFDDARVYEPVTEYLEDPLENEGELPVLALTGLAVAFVGGQWVASVDVNASAVAYEFERKWAGELGWTRANFGASPTAVIPSDGGGVLMVRARAWGDASFGPYTPAVSSNVGGGVLSVTLSRDSIADSVTRPPTRVFGYAQGGTPPYVSYAWVRTAGSASIEPYTPAAPDTAFRRPAYVPPGGNVSADFVLRVTDSVGGIADSAPLVVTIWNFSAGVDP